MSPRFKNAIDAGHKMSAGGGSCTLECTSTPTGQDSSFHVYRIDRESEGVRFTFEDASRYAAAGDNGDMAIMVRNFLQSSDLLVDWVRARPLIIIPEPIYDRGQEPTLF